MAWTLSPFELRDRLAGFPPPAVIDARSDEAFAANPQVIFGAIRQDPAAPVDALSRELEPWRTVVVYCAHGGDKGLRVAQALRQRGFDAWSLEGGLDAWRAAESPLVPWQPSSHWVTRERPKIDRIACPWLVRRFVDPSAKFHFVPETEVHAFAPRTGAVPFDVPGALYGHAGDRCSFDAFLRLHAPDDPALAAVGAIVRAADTGRLDLSAQAPGLLAISRGLGRMQEDDAQLLRWGMLVYDALYLACRDEHAGSCERSPASTRTAHRA